MKLRLIKQNQAFAHSVRNLTQSICVFVFTPSLSAEFTVRFCSRRASAGVEGSAAGAPRRDAETRTRKHEVRHLIAAVKLRL